MPDGSIVLMGGYDGVGGKNDTWRSTDNGATWTLVNASAGWTARWGHSSVAMPDGSIVLTGGDAGVNKNDVWRSTDYGATWRQVNASAGWTARNAHTSVVMPDGSIVLMGGNAGGYKNDVWRFMPAGSSVQNPSHTYTALGIYQVALQVYNASGYNSTRKTGYISVTGPAPVANFTANVTFGYTPLSVRFNDTSTGSPTTWNWMFGDIGGSNTSTLQNPVHTYTTSGNFTVKLIVANSGGNATLTRTEYISVRIRGDFNTNGRVDIVDVTRVAYMAVGLIPKDPNANFKGYGVVDSADAAKIAYYYVGKINTL
jgi:PKD repeat protein